LVADAREAYGNGTATFDKDAQSPRKRHVVI
jgi:hypothetical protein